MDERDGGRIEDAPTLAGDLGGGGSTLTAGADRYERRALLGVGGMGEVHLCLDRVIGREVALKRMSDESERASARFTREALIHARLEHPAIVPVYDVSLDGPAWFTMKRIHGRSLFDILAAMRAADEAARAAYSRHKLLAAFVQICLAVDYAHSRGVIHRDLKPSNVMFGEFGEVNVLDWGLAKIVGERGTSIALGESSADDDTVAGALMGTPGYMSPEQARGAGGALGPASDVYALGAILFEILTLTPLHEGRHAITLLAHTMRGVDARPSARGHDVAPELEAACVRATALDPAERFSSARELAQAVERFLEGDRDVERRRAMAEEHVDHARQKLAKGDRAEALRDLGRAIALDPTRMDAVDILAATLVDAPSTVPPAAHEELGVVRSAAYRTAMRMASYRYLLWLAFLPFAFWMGIEDWITASAIIALFFVTAFEPMRRSAKSRPELIDGVVLLALSAITTAATSAVLGPFVLVPGLAATNSLFMAMHGPRRYRPLVIATGALTIAVPFALEILGVVPAGYRFTGEGLLLVPRVVRFPELATTVTLIGTTIATVIIPGVLAGRMRDALTNAEKRLFLQEWQLRQLLPATVRPKLAPNAERISP
jgi:hypothetical protein